MLRLSGQLLFTLRLLTASEHGVTTVTSPAASSRSDSRPRWHDGRCDCKNGALVSVAEAGGRRIERSRGSVVGDLARLLLADGADGAAELHVVDRHTGKPRLMPQSLGHWARTTIEEGAEGLRVRRWRPLSSRAGGRREIGQLAPAGMEARGDG